MQITMGTSPVESLVAAGNIFVGQVSYKIDNTQIPLGWAQIHWTPKNEIKPES